MPRLLGVDIPNDKQVIYSLQYLYGVGPIIAREACVKTKINPTKQARDLDEDIYGACYLFADRASR